MSSESLHQPRVPQSECRCEERLVSCGTGKGTKALVKADSEQGVFGCSCSVKLWFNCGFADRGEAALPTSRVLTEVLERSQLRCFLAVGILEITCFVREMSVKLQSHVSIILLPPFPGSWQPALRGGKKGRIKETAKGTLFVCLNFNEKCLYAQKASPSYFVGFC